MRTISSGVADRLCNNSSVSLQNVGAGWASASEIAPAGLEPGDNLGRLRPDGLVLPVRCDNSAQPGRLGGFGDGGVVREMAPLEVLQRLVDDEQASRSVRHGYA